MQADLEEYLYGSLEDLAIGFHKTLLTLHSI